MNDVTILLVAVLLLMAVLSSGFSAWLILKIQADAARREERLIALVRNLASRIQARDLQSYLAIQAQDQPPPGNGVTNNLDEDALDAMRLGMAVGGGN